MAVNPPQPLAHGVASVPHFAPPSARELRVQSVHRLQVGLFGVCAMLLIVALANIIMERARLAEFRDPAAAVAAKDQPTQKAASDPLADIGVVPADPSAAGRQQGAKAP